MSLKRKCPAIWQTVQVDPCSAVPLKRTVLHQTLSLAGQTNKKGHRTPRHTLPSTNQA